MSVTLDSTTLASGLSSGLGIVTGRGTMSSNYQSGGEPIDLSNYFNSSSNITIMIGAVSNYYYLSHTQGSNAAASNIVVGISNSEASNTTFTEIDAETDLSTLTFDFTAIGKLR